MAGKPAIAELYGSLLRAYGPQGWWPADHAFEMMVGAILIQHTAWSNAEKALDNIRQAGLFDPHRLEALSAPRLAALIRPAGMFNVKARRLKNFLCWYRTHGGFDALCKQDTLSLRTSLLTVHGIGRETADDMLVYAFQRPVFVVDAYARRIFRRLGLVSGAESHEDLRARVENEMPDDAVQLGELHALLVTHAKTVCKSRPKCARCCLRKKCPRIPDE